ncbi:MAG: penicillin acylase family protein [Ardenticatenaceae bacterium]|nr:penicillin acylase family protein [Ardenticatenaceae bacterium]MCB9444653.1 penicillin acylase family protein [Ardenticatenaceae bacterium]
MNRLARIGLIIVGILLVIVVAGAITLTVIIRRPFPETDGTLTLNGLQDKVEVYRDEYGIPHIYAQNEADLFFAQGYVTAQDRFWQMEFWRHVGQGRISEIVGEATLDSDKFIRNMGWNRMAQTTADYYKNEAPEYYAILEAYSAGVNAYIDAHRDDLSVNQTILGQVGEPWEIEPWTPVNTISWGVVMSDNLSGSMFDEIHRAEQIKVLGEANVATWEPFYPYGDRPVIVPTEEMVNELPEMGLLLGEDTAVAQTIDWNHVNLSVMGTPPDAYTFGAGPFVGSNNWVVSGEHTASGLPLLANDPHLAIQMPSIWYEVGLHAPGFDVTGFSFAGVPGVVIGHNDKIAWGVTNSGPDVQDLFIEKINPSNPDQYEYQGEWQDMEIIPEVIKVNGGEDVTLNVRVTRHGPIINEVVDGLSDVLAVQWTAEEPSRVLQSVILLNQAQNHADFREALRYWDIPSQNVIYADVEGNIAYQMPGRIPIRKDGNGLVPVPGWTGEYDWDGWIPYEDLPAAFNPEKGYIVTANNAIVDEDYPYFLTYYWDNGNRSQRITEMLEAAIDRGNVTAADFARIQFDSKSLLAEKYVPLLQNLSSSNSQVQAAIERLRGWDLQERRDSVPATLFEIFYLHLKWNVLVDDTGKDLFHDVASTNAGTVFFQELADQANAIWWDDVTTTKTETREDIILQSLSDAIDWLEEHQGGEMNDWTWGSLHTATFVSNPLGASGVGPIESLVNRGPFPSDGGSSIVNAMSWSWEDPAKVTAHPSMRMIVDMSNLDASQTIIPTGQSGHPYHKHYDDMFDLYLNGKYHPMLWSREAVEAAAADVLILQPGE